jgi:hypothetical protein
LAFDASDDGVLDIPTLASALRGRGVDVVIGDACLLETLEIAGELRDVTRYLAGTEQIEAYHGLPYAEVIAALAQPSTTARSRCGDDFVCAAAASIPEVVERNRGEAREASAALDLSAIGEVERALARVAEAAGAAVDADPLLAIDQAMLLSPRGVPHFLGGTRDVGALLAAIEALADTHRLASLAAAVRAARAALEGAVVARYLGPYYLGQGGAGVSMWLPFDRADWERRWPSYQSSAVHQRVGTAAWMARVLRR